MTARFADTFFFLALLIEEDEAHDRAVQITRGLGTPLLTTTWVLLEVANFVAKPPGRERFHPLLDFLRVHPHVTILAPASEQFDEGVRLYHERPDKDWSLTDCISFVVMREHGLTEALTADHHFEQAGFAALLR